MTDLNKLAAEMRAAAEAATPGPWHHSRDNWFIPKAEEDLFHIAAANPKNVLALLDERERLLALLCDIDCTGLEHDGECWNADAALFQCTCHCKELSNRIDAALAGAAPEEGQT